MTEDKTECVQCGRSILKRTAERRGGMCAPCERNAQMSPEELFEETVFIRIEEMIQPFSSYKNAIAALAEHPRGYSLCFAFHYVHAELLNGGVSQLHSNSAWPLIVDAVEAAETAGTKNVASLLREIIYYYHQRNRSKFKRRITDEYFAGIPSDWHKALTDLDAEYLTIEKHANSVIPKLCKQRNKLFDESANIRYRT